MKIVIDGEYKDGTGLVQLSLEFEKTGTEAPVKVKIKDEWVTVKVRELRDAIKLFRPWDRSP